MTDCINLSARLLDNTYQPNKLTIYQLEANHGHEIMVWATSLCILLNQLLPGVNLFFLSFLTRRQLLYVIFSNEPITSVNLYYWTLCHLLSFFQIVAHSNFAHLKMFIYDLAKLAFLLLATRRAFLREPLKAYSQGDFTIKVEAKTWPLLCQVDE